MVLREIIKQLRVWLQTELDNTIPCYQLIITITIYHKSKTKNS